MKIRVIVNGTDIYPLKKNEPVVINLTSNNPKIVVTDGYHITKSLELVYHHVHTYYFKVVCAIGDYQMAAGLFLLMLLYLLGTLSGIVLVRVLSFFPILYFLFLYYINRKDFLQIRAT
ncbi:MAG: hypothetical protein ICV66_04180 [Chitinophagaceae bacterium]|nr:hypothetical protein [Chitinophagaceae bacterium]